MFARSRSVVAGAVRRQVAKVKDRGVVVFDDCGFRISACWLHFDCLPDKNQSSIRILPRNRGDYQVKPSALECTFQAAADFAANSLDLLAHAL